MTNNSEDSENLHKADQVYFLYDPQPVRLLDVIYVGPIMIYGGIKGKFHPFVKWSLIGVGICTILYNGANFFINEKSIACFVHCAIAQEGCDDFGMKAAHG